MRAAGRLSWLKLAMARPMGEAGVSIDWQSASRRFASYRAVMFRASRPFCFRASPLHHTFMRMRDTSDPGIQMEGHERTTEALKLPKPVKAWRKITD